MQLLIKEKNRQLVWGLGALENLQNELGLSLNDIDIALMENDAKVLYRLVYCALENGAEIEGDTLDFNYKYFLNWLDNQEDKVAKDIVNDFMKSKILGKTVEQTYDEVIARLNANLDTEVTPSPKKKAKPKV